MLHALNHTLQWLLVSTVFGTASSLHLILFLHLFHSFFPHREHLHNIEGSPVLRCVWISTRISGYRSRYIIIRPCARYISENTHARNPTRDSRNGIAYCGNFRISQSRLLKGTNCLFASKDHVRPVSKRLCIIFMACSCPISVLGMSAPSLHRESTDSLMSIMVAHSSALNAFFHLQGPPQYHYRHRHQV